MSGPSVDADLRGDPDPASGPDDPRGRSREAPARGHPHDQLRAEPSVDPRRPPPRRRPRRRDRRRHSRRHRLPPHRLREEHGGQVVVEVGHVRAAHRLRLVPRERAPLRPRDREAPRHRGPAARDLGTDGAGRAEPHPLASRLARDVGARARGDLAVLVLLRRPRPDPRPLRDGRRGADAHALRAGRRHRRGPASRVHGRGAEVLRVDAEVGRRVRGDPRPQRDLARADEGSRAALRRRRHRTRAVGPDAPGVGRGLGPAQGDAVPRLRRGRVRRAGLCERRRVRPLPGAHGRDAGVGANRPPVPRPARRDGGRAVDRRRSQGRPAAAPRAAHVDGVAHPPLQDRHRGVHRARGRGLRRHRVATRRGRLLPRLRRRAAARGA